MEWNETKFWELYDEYINIPVDQVDEKLVNELSAIVRDSPDSLISNMKREKKNWKLIRAWEAIKFSKIIFKGMNHYHYFFKGEIIVLDYPYDRDMMFSRIPKEESVSWGIYDLSNEMNQTKGDFIPLFDKSVILQRVKNILRIKVEENIKELEEFFDCARSF